TGHRDGRARRALRQGMTQQTPGGSRRRPRDPGDQEESMAHPYARVTRRQALRTGAGALFIPFTLRAGQAHAHVSRKPVDGVTLNISCWSASYPKLIADYLPEFQEKPGIKVNYDTPGFPV